MSVVSSDTQFFSVEKDSRDRVKLILADVYQSLREKGYNPVNQIVGYIMSGDPTYITSHQSARSLIMKVERDELVEELLSEYIKTKGWDSRKHTGTGLWLENGGRRYFRSDGIYCNGGNHHSTGQGRQVTKDLCGHRGDLRRERGGENRPGLSF